ncbi:unnamed protein product [Pedinophyceae sp. YPF-701]|nr:unnamed protein product [Pedinophyceae sp. YPF-701]
MAVATLADLALGREGPGKLALHLDGSSKGGLKLHGQCYTWNYLGRDGKRAVEYVYMPVQHVADGTAATAADTTARNITLPLTWAWRTPAYFALGPSKLLRMFDLQDEEMFARGIDETPEAHEDRLRADDRLCNEFLDLAMRAIVSTLHYQVSDHASDVMAFEKAMKNLVGEDYVAQRLGCWDHKIDNAFKKTAAAFKEAWDVMARTDGLKDLPRPDVMYAKGVDGRKMEWVGSHQLGLECEMMFSAEAKFGFLRQSLQRSAAIAEDALKEAGDPDAKALGSGKFMMGQYGVARYLAGQDNLGKLLMWRHLIRAEERRINGPLRTTDKKYHHRLAKVVNALEQPAYTAEMIAGVVLYEVFAGSYWGAKGCANKKSYEDMVKHGKKYLAVAENFTVQDAADTFKRLQDDEHKDLKAPWSLSDSPSEAGWVGCRLSKDENDENKRVNIYLRTAWLAYKDLPGFELGDDSAWHQAVHCLLVSAVRKSAEVLRRFMYKHDGHVVDARASTHNLAPPDNACVESMFGLFGCTRRGRKQAGPKHLAARVCLQQPREFLFRGERGELLPAVRAAAKKWAREQPSRKKAYVAAAKEAAATAAAVAHHEATRVFEDKEVDLYDVLRHIHLEGAREGTDEDGFYAPAADAHAKKQVTVAHLREIFEWFRDCGVSRTVGKNKAEMMRNCWDLLCREIPHTVDRLRRGEIIVRVRRIHRANLVEDAERLLQYEIIPGENAANTSDDASASAPVPTWTPAAPPRIEFSQHSPVSSQAAGLQQRYDNQAAAVVAEAEERRRQKKQRQQDDDDVEPTPEQQLRMWRRLHALHGEGEDEYDDEDTMGDHEPYLPVGV